MPATATPASSQKPAIASRTTTIGTITPDQAAAHIGKQVTVCDKVYGTRFLNNGPAFLNMGSDYPDNPFTAVIMFEKRSSFSYKPEEFLKGKAICVTGAVKNYKGKPEIAVEKEEQVKAQQEMKLTLSVIVTKVIQSLYYCFIMIPLIFLAISAYSYLSVKQTIGQEPTTDDEVFAIVRAKHTKVDILINAEGKAVNDIFMPCVSSYQSV